MNRKIIIPLMLIMLVVSININAEIVDSFQQAKTAASNSGNVILVELYDTQCKSCRVIEDAKDSDKSISVLFSKFILFSANVTEKEGKSLARQYKAGQNFPVFLLLDKEGKVLNKWISYRSITFFLRTLRKNLIGTMTVDEKVSFYHESPTDELAFLLAKDFASHNKYSEAIKYFKEARKLKGNNKKDFSYAIFNNSAKAVLNNDIPFEQLLLAADEMVEFTTNKKNIIKSIITLTGVAKEKNKTSMLGKYLEAGINASNNSQTPKDKGFAADFEADLALYIDLDIEKAIAIKKKYMGLGWRMDPKLYFPFANWCLDRKINLKAAEKYAREASVDATGGQFRGFVFNVIAELCYEQGKIDEATANIRKALNEDPNNKDFKANLKKYTKR